MDEIKNLFDEFNQKNAYLYDDIVSTSDEIERRKALKEYSTALIKFILYKDINIMNEELQELSNKLDNVIT